LHGIYQVDGVAIFNLAFGPLRTTIENPAFRQPVLVSDAVCLLYATRNQVAHHVEIGMNSSHSRIQPGLRAMSRCRYAACELGEFDSRLWNWVDCANGFTRSSEKITT
jgi:hypothetical protein